MPAGLPILFVAALGWPEVIGCAMIVMILFGAKKLPGLTRGFGRDWDEFGTATNDVQAYLDSAVEETGRSVAGIHGKPALEGLTQDNRVAEFYSIPKRDESTSLRMKFSDKLIVFVAQGFGIGRIPFAPGTWGTLLGLLLVSLTFREEPFPLTLLVMGLLFPIPAVLVCGRAERTLGRDPGSVVLDEIVAMPLCFFAPAFLWTQIKGMAGGVSENLLFTCVLIAGFLLFRLFDIWKPWPVHQSQNLPGGWGVVMDDVLAAVYVNLVALALFAAASLFG